MYVICGVLSITVVVLSIYSFTYFKSRKRIKNFFIDNRKYTPGRMGLVKNWTLSYSDGTDEDKAGFGVDYDVEITDSTEKEVKVRAIDYSCYNKRANDPNNRSDIMSHMVDKWMKKSKVQLVVDISTLRNDKLGKILDGE